ncbi:MAG: tryptophan-rich sensory protein [Oscillospiraceae bacterium]|nr:tryptophan-rich sensory protein [Oscillospiraceae bacterium]
MKKTVNIKSLAVCVAIPLLVGGLSSLLIRNSFSVYETEALPPLAPPPVVFPIVWAVLYILMGVSSYLIWRTGDQRRFTALTVYGVQLVMNFIWPLLFFEMREFLFAVIWLGLLFIAVLAMAILFKKLRPAAGILQIPYLLWLAFAFYLNLGVYLLN